MRSLPNGLAHCLTIAASAIAPRRQLVVSQWADDHRVLTVAEIRDDGYINLINGTKLVVTASPCHEIEEIK